MIQMQTVLNVADNSGAKEVMCVKVLGGSKKMLAGIGDLIVVCVKSIANKASSSVTKGGVYTAVVVRSKYGCKRSDGSSVKFDDNAVVLLSKQLEPMGSRVFGPVARELRRRSLKIVSLAPEVV